LFDYCEPTNPHGGILFYQASLLLLAIVTTYIGQALSLKASAVGSVDHYERNERARDIGPEDLNSGQCLTKYND
jgi:hypothetical protein